MIDRGRLVKRATADGLVEVYEHVPLGKVYRVDWARRQIMSAYNLERGVWHRKDMVWCQQDDGVEWGWFPTELLEAI